MRKTLTTLALAAAIIAPTGAAVAAGQNTYPSYVVQIKGNPERGFTLIYNDGWKDRIRPLDTAVDGCKAAQPGHPFLRGYCIGLAQDATYQVLRFKRSLNGLGVNGAYAQ